jgi:N12 class adenine-specific DNA methylase
MNTVVQADRVHVLQRLRDLRDWARFIHESMSADQPFESGKRELLAAYMGEAFLREFDSDSSSLAERLDGIIERIESTAAPATRAAICSR